MEKDFEKFVADRCNAAIMNNSEYAEIENSTTDPNVIQAKAEKVCYIQGMRDMFNLILKLSL